MEVKQLGHQGTLVPTPCVQFDVVTDAHGIPETDDRDCRLVQALRRREATAAERLVATFGDRAYRLAIGITGNQQDAEAAVQDSLWNVAVARFDEDGHHGDFITDGSTNLADSAVQRELRDVLASAIDELPPHYRAAIVRRDGEGLSITEVAEGGSDV